MDLDEYELSINMEGIESLRAMASFEEFKQYVRTRDVDKGKNLPLPNWGYLNKATTMVCEEKRLVVLKARQILISWLIVAYFVWKCMRKEDVEILIISQSRQTAQIMVRRAYSIYDNLPDWLRETVSVPKNRSKEKVEFSNGSRIVSLSSKPDASRGMSPDAVLIDEAAYCRDLKLMLAAVAPQLTPSSQLFIVSTPNPEMVGRHFTHICKEYKALGYRLLKIPYDSCPKYRDPEWIAEKRAEMSPQKFAHEYECSLSIAGEGMILSSFTKENIETDGFIPNRNYTLYRAIDPGPKMAVIWLAEDIAGNVIVYREAYFHGKSTAVRAAIIMRLSGDEDYRWTVIDSADPQNKTDLAKHGIHTRLCPTKDVFGTIDILNGMFEADGYEAPTVMISDECPKLIDQIREWMGDDCGYPVKGQYDHGIDALRYALHILHKVRRKGKNGGFALDQSPISSADEGLGIEKRSLVIDDEIGFVNQNGRDFSENDFGTGFGF